LLELDDLEAGRPKLSADPVPVSEALRDAVAMVGSMAERADGGRDAMLRQLRDDPETSNRPVVIVSADATCGEIAWLPAAGAAGYVTKPIDVRELLRVLDDVLMVQPDG
jgi:CheY-like chemotaxis protein